MSSRVGTAIPASRSTALSSAAVGFTRSIQTALSGRCSSSVMVAFFSDDSVGTNTENMQNSGRDEGRSTKRRAVQEGLLMKRAFNEQNLVTKKDPTRFGKPFVKTNQGHQSLRPGGGQRVAEFD